MEKSTKSRFEELFGSTEDGNIENLVTDKIVMGNLNILRVAYIGRNGRIYLECMCNGCNEHKAYFLEEEINNYNPAVDCPNCKNR